MKQLVLATTFFVTQLYHAQSPETLKIGSYRQQNEHAIVNEFVSLTTTMIIISMLKMKTYASGITGTA